MLTRREFIQTGAVAGLSIAAAPGLSSAVEMPKGPMLRIETNVFDQRHGLSRAFSEAMQAAEVKGFDGDISPLWRSHLSAHWKAAGRSIAGLTEHGPLFILERMGWSKDMRATFRAQHRTNAQGYLEHELQGPSEVIAALEQSLPQSGTDFAQALAEALALHPAGKVEMQKLTLTTQTKSNLDEPMYSFVLTPRCDCAGLSLYSHQHSA